MLQDIKEISHFRKTSVAKERENTSNGLFIVIRPQSLLEGTDERQPDLLLREQISKLFSSQRQPDKMCKPMPSTCWEWPGMESNKMLLLSIHSKKKSYLKKINEK